MNKSIIVIAFLITLISLATKANNALPGKVSHVVTGGPLVYFKVEQATHIGCATEKRYVVNTTTVFGKNTYAMLMLAYASNAKVGIVSGNTCSTSADSEDIIHAYLQ